MSERLDPDTPTSLPTVAGGGGQGGTVAGEPGERVEDESGSGAADATTRVGRMLAGRADPATNTVVTWVLRSGLGLAFAILLAGLFVQLATGPSKAVGVRMFDLFAPRPLGERIMAVGVLVLSVTPACGVLSVLLSWLRERDWVYVGVGAVVVVVLSAAVLVGFG